MPFEWKDYVDLAQLLQQQAGSTAQSEALFRTALNRAYYGAFCHARNYASECLGFRARNDADDHGRLREHLKKGKRRGISDRLQRLREWRNECDYHDELSFDAETVLKVALSEAHFVVASLTPPPASSQP